MVAARQHGVVTRAQLRALGLSPAAITYRASAGHLHRLHRAVYAVGHPAVSAEGRWAAAVLACGPDAHLSHASCRELRGLTDERSALIHVSVRRDSPLRHPGIRVHRVSSLTSADLTAATGIPCTSVARTLLDLAAGRRLGELALAIGRAQRRRLLDLAAVQELIARSRGHRGVALLRVELENLLPHGGVPRSTFERRFLGMIRAHGLPEPVVNGLIRLEHQTLQVDFHWPGARLIVEADGYASHSDSIAHEEDRRRDQELKLAGWEVLRFTWKQLTREPVRTARIIRELLEARRAER